MLTYGDDGARRGAGIAQLSSGDLLAFHAGLRPIVACEHRPIYAVVDLFVIAEGLTRSLGLTNERFRRSGFLVRIGFVGLAANHAADRARRATLHPREIRH